MAQMTTGAPPLCMVCKHLNSEDQSGWSCAAFPHGIPYAIITNGWDHRQPIKGDGGTQFEHNGKNKRLLQVVERRLERAPKGKALYANVPIYERAVAQKGGEGSGHFGHEGRPGHVGGSKPGGAIATQAGRPSASVLANIERLIPEQIRRGLQLTENGLQGATYWGDPLRRMMYNPETQDLLVSYQDNHAEMLYLLQRPMSGYDTYVKMHRVRDTDPWFIRAWFPEQSYTEAWKKVWDTLQALISVGFTDDTVVKINFGAEYGPPKTQTIGEFVGMKSPDEVMLVTATIKELLSLGRDYNLTRLPEDLGADKIDYGPEPDMADSSIKGGPGSGHFSHEGRPGHVGGSKPSGRAPDDVAVERINKEDLEEARYDLMSEIEKRWPEDRRGMALGAASSDTRGDTPLWLYVMREGDELVGVMSLGIWEKNQVAGYFLATKRRGYGERLFRYALEQAITQGLGFFGFGTDLSRGFYEHVGIPIEEGSHKIDLTVDQIKAWLSSRTKADPGTYEPEDGVFLAWPEKQEVNS